MDAAVTEADEAWAVVGGAAVVCSKPNSFSATVFASRLCVLRCGFDEAFDARGVAVGAGVARIVEAMCADLAAGGLAERALPAGFFGA